MKKYLVDTNVPSELTRERPDSAVAAFLTSVDQTNFYLSAMPIGEIAKGIAAMPLGRRRTATQLWFATDVRVWFSGRILPVTEAIAKRWGILSAVARSRGTPLPVVDGIIAATALEHGLTLATRNQKNFIGLGVDLFNPWEQ